MDQLKSIYNSPFKSSNSHPLHTYLTTIVSNEYRIYCKVLGCILICSTFAMHECLQETKEHGATIVSDIENQAKSEEREETKGISTVNKVLNSSH